MSSRLPFYADHGYSDAKTDVPELSAASFLPAPLGTAKGAVFARAMSPGSPNSHVNLRTFIPLSAYKRTNGESYTQASRAPRDGEVGAPDRLFDLVNLSPFVLFFSVGRYFM